MGYVKLICFCIWAVQKIEQLRDKKVTSKPSGRVLTWITAILVALQLASGIGLTVFGVMIETLPSSKFPASVHLPTVAWIGIVPILAAIIGLIVVFRMLRKHIVIWILVNGALCLGNGILMSYTDVFTPSKYGLKDDDIDRCQKMSWVDPVSTTTTTTTTRSPYILHWNNDNMASVSDSGYGNNPPLTCDMVKTLGVILLPGLTNVLLIYLGLVVFVTVFASVIGCCLQECVEDQSLNGPDFVPVGQVMERPVMTQPNMSYAQGSYPQQPGNMFMPAPGMYQPNGQWQGQYAPPPQSSGYPNNPYGHAPEPQFRPAEPQQFAQPSAPQDENAEGFDGSEGFRVESDRKFLV